MEGNHDPRVGPGPLKCPQQLPSPSRSNPQECGRPQATHTWRSSDLTHLTRHPRYPTSAPSSKARSQQLGPKASSCIQRRPIPGRPPLHLQAHKCSAGHPLRLLNPAHLLPHSICPAAGPPPCGCYTTLRAPTADPPHTEPVSSYGSESVSMRCAS